MMGGTFAMELEPTMRKRLLLIILCLLLIPVTLSAQQSREDAPDLYNTRYADDHRRQRLDVYLPAGDTPAPVVVAIHGGGYLFGEKRDLTNFADGLRDAGYAVVTPNYRLAPDVTYPTPIEDMTCALAWTHAHAETYNFDTDRVYIAGDSAGGNAALLMGLTDDLNDYFNSACDHPAPETWLHGIVAYYPIVDLSTCAAVCEPARRATALYLGGEALTPDLWGTANPVTHIDADDPPVLLIHGTADRVVPDSESRYLVDLLGEAGVPVDLHLIDGADHAFIDLIDRPDGAAALAIMDEWLAERQ